jgi:hypothetical protein
MKPDARRLASPVSYARYESYATRR